MEAPSTLQEAIVHFAVPQNANQFLADLRWADGKPRCPQCGSDHVTYLAKQNRYKCYGKHPKAQFSLKVGTIFEDSPIGLDKWLCALWLIVNCKNGISSCEMARDLGITQKSAWFLDHRIRFALHQGRSEQAPDRFRPLQVGVLADRWETFDMESTHRQRTGESPGGRELRKRRHVRVAENAKPVSLLGLPAFFVYVQTSQTAMVAYRFS